MTGQGGGLADGATAAGIFLVCMAAAGMIAVSTFIWGWFETKRVSQPFDRILAVPLVIVIAGVAMLFGAAALQGKL